MYQIVLNETLVPNIVRMRFRAPEVARSARPGQFVIIRSDESAERIPMGLAGWDASEGTVDIVFYVLGTGTVKLSLLREGDCVANLAGPLGKPTEIENFGTVICACGCFGVGPTMPLIKALKEAGNHVITVVEGRGPDFIFWENELRQSSDELIVAAGCSNGGWANDYLGKILGSGRKVDRVFLHGCPFMMMVSSQATMPFAVKTVASLTPIMVDGTGMCGACRVEVDGKTRFACVDGPDFDAHQINWDVLTMRLRQFLSEEDRSQNLWERENWHRMVSEPAKIPASSSPAKTIRQPVEQVLHQGRCTTI